MPTEIYQASDSPIDFYNISFNPVTRNLTFDIKIARLAESHLALYQALATGWGASLGSMTKTVTGTASATTGDIDIHVVLS